MLLRLTAFLLIGAGLFLGLSRSSVAQPPEDGSEEQTEATVSYYRQVRPILQRHCTGCHFAANP